MGHEVIAKKGAGKHRGSNIHTNTGVIQKKAVMELERHGDGVMDGAQQNTCHIWSETTTNTINWPMRAKRAPPPPPPLYRTAAVSLGGVARLATCGHFRLISIQIL